MLPSDHKRFNGDTPPEGDVMAMAGVPPLHGPAINDSPNWICGFSVSVCVIIVLHCAESVTVRV